MNSVFSIVYMIGLFHMHQISNAQSLVLVKSFGFHTAYPAASTSTHPVNITLNYNSIIYQCQVIPTTPSTEFPCDGTESYIPSNCDIVSNLMFVENTHYVAGNINGVNLDYVFVVTSNNIEITVSVGANRQYGFIVLDQNDYQSNTVLVDIGQNDFIYEPNFYPCTSLAPVSYNFTESTIHPSNSPTTLPTNLPSNSPTTLPTAKIKISGLTVGLFLLVLLLLLCGVLVIVIVYCYKCYKPEKKSLYITNGLVIIIGIAEYETNINIDPEKDEIGGYLLDLPAIDKDIANMVDLFHNKLNYQVYPSEYLNISNKGYKPKLYWTEQELKHFLEDRANYLEKHIDKYDGLIVIISSHGIKGSICVSDYRTFSKNAIHRIFSSSHPKSRTIPRLFLLDCCSGNNQCNQQEKLRAESIGVQGKAGKVITENTDSGKRVTVVNVDGERADDTPWLSGQHNPDYQLAIIESSNYGFQSKLSKTKGSYVIYSFYRKTIDILRKKKKTFIHKIFDQIQNELHQKGMQHPTYVWNDNTRYIRFKKNTTGNGLNYTTKSQTGNVLNDTYYRI